MVSEFLGRGAAAARTRQELCDLLHVAPRELTKLIERERRQGQPICASNDGTRPGYFLAATKSEMHLYCRSLWHRAGEIHKTRQACLQTIDQLPEEDESI